MLSLAKLNLPTPGYTEMAIKGTEIALQMRFHPTFRQALLQYRFESAVSRSLCFVDSPAADFLTAITRWNLTPSLDLLKLPYFVIAQADGCWVVLNNDTGEIGSICIDDLKLHPLAGHFEAFVCIAALIKSQSWEEAQVTITYNESLEKYDFDQGVRQMREFLVKHQIAQGEHFWLALAQGWV